MYQKDLACDPYNMIHKDTNKMKEPTDGFNSTKCPTTEQEKDSSPKLPFYFDVNELDEQFELDLPSEFRLTSSNLSIDLATKGNEVDDRTCDELEIITNMSMRKRMVSFDIDRNEYYYIERPLDEDDSEYEADDERFEEDIKSDELNESKNALLQPRVVQLDEELGLKDDDSFYENVISKIEELTCKQTNSKHNDLIVDTSIEITTKDQDDSSTGVKEEEKPLEELNDQKSIEENKNSIRNEAKLCSDVKDDFIVKTSVASTSAQVNNNDRVSFNDKVNYINKIIQKAALPDFKVEYNEEDLNNNKKLADTAPILNKNEKNDGFNTISAKNKYLQSNDEMELQNTETIIVEDNLQKEIESNEFPSIIANTLPSIKNNPFILQDRKRAK